MNYYELTIQPWQNKAQQNHVYILWGFQQLSDQSHIVLGHETMVCTVCLSIFILLLNQIAYCTHISMCLNFKHLWDKETKWPIPMLTVQIKSIQWKINTSNVHQICQTQSWLWLCLRKFCHGYPSNYTVPDHLQARWLQKVTNKFACLLMISNLFMLITHTYTYILF